MTDYATLQADVADWLNKSNLTARIPSFIKHAELRLGRDFDVPAMFSRATLNFSAGTPYADLPANTVAVLAAYIDGDTDTPLNYMTVDQLIEQYPISTSGKPRVYTVLGKEGTNLLEMMVGYNPDSAYSVMAHLRKTIPVLSGSVSQNYWTDNMEDLLLYGSLIAAEPFLRRDSRIATWKALYDEAYQREKMLRRKYLNTGQQAGQTPSGDMVA